MDRDLNRTQEVATEVDEAGPRPPDEDLAYDPAMTEADEANFPEDSDADPNSDA